MSDEEIDALSVYADRYADSETPGQMVFPGRWRVVARVRMPRQQAGCRYWGWFYRLERIDGLGPGGVAEEVMLEGLDFLTRFHVVDEGLEE